MQPLRIVIDVRPHQGLRIGTYIRNLVAALSGLDQHNKYLLSAFRRDIPEFGHLAPNFETVVYDEPEKHRWEDVDISLVP